MREDDKIADLNYMIGPKLYEANWMYVHVSLMISPEVPMTCSCIARIIRDLAAKGHIANVQVGAGPQIMFCNKWWLISKLSVPKSGAQ